MTQDYNADSVQKLSFVEGVRKRVGIYLGSADMGGVISGLLELVNNSTDESLVYSSANEIEIEIADKWASCRDKGRGFPRGPNKFSKEVMIDLLTENHSGAKFDENAYGGKSRGLNGSGGSATCCSSDWFDIESKRDGYTWTMRFEKGIPTTPIAVQGAPTKQTGTYIKYQPSQDVFLSEEIHFVYTDVCNIIEEYSYFNKGILFRVINFDTGEKREFLSKNGLIDFAKNKIKNPIHSNPIYNQFSSNGIDVEVIAYWTKGKENFYLFSNGGENPNGGTPITGARTAITRNINKIIGKDNLSGEMVRTGLVYIISVQLKNPIYDGQTKTRITNPELRGVLDRAFSDGIEIFKNKYPDEMKTIIDFLNKEQKADEAAQRAREAILNHTKIQIEASKKKVLLADKLKDCKEHGENSTLIIVEGDSAMGSLMSARSIDRTALQPIRGKIINALRHPMEEVLENKEVNDIILSLGCGINGSYSSKKLRYGSVAIAVDGDADGYNIMCLITTLFYKLMPKFIEEGRLKWLRAPLYKIKYTKQTLFAYNDSELKDIQKKHGAGAVSRIKGLGELNTEDVRNSMFSKDQRIEVLSYTGDKEEATTQLEMLMGDDVPSRKEFIMDNIDFELLED